MHLNVSGFIYLAEVETQDIISTSSLIRNILHDMKFIRNEDNRFKLFIPELFILVFSLVNIIVISVTSSFQGRKFYHSMFKSIREHGRCEYNKREDFLV